MLLKVTSYQAITCLPLKQRVTFHGLCLNLFENKLWMTHRFKRCQKLYDFLLIEHSFSFGDEVIEIGVKPLQINVVPFD
jgi:hypothetical protein